MCILRNDGSSHRSDWSWDWLGALLGGPDLSAHHSLASQFDEGKPLTLQGVITKVEWVNPHVWVHIDVKDTGGAVGAMVSGDAATRDVAKRWLAQ